MLLSTLYVRPILINFFLDILEPSFPPIFKMLTSISSVRLYWTSSKTRHGSILYAKISSPGCARLSIIQGNETNTVVVRLITHKKSRRLITLSALNPKSLNDIPQSSALEHATLHSDLLSAYDIPEETRPGSAISSPVGDSSSHTETSSLRVGVIVHRAASGYTARANTLHTYLELNRHVSPNHPFFQVKQD